MALLSVMLTGGSEPQAASRSTLMHLAVSTQPAVDCERQCGIDSLERPALWRRLAKERRVQLHLAYWRLNTCLNTGDWTSTGGLTELSVQHNAMPA